MTVSTPVMASQSVTTFSPLRIRSADTPPQLEKVITPGREPTREERKLARRRNGPMDVLPHYVGKRMKFTLPSAFDSELVIQSQHCAHTTPSSKPSTGTTEQATPKAFPDPSKQSTEAGPSTPKPNSSSKALTSLTGQVPTKSRAVSEHRQVTNGARSTNLSGSRGHQISSCDPPAKPKGLRGSVKGKEKASSITEGRTILKKVKKFWSSELDHAGGPLEFASPSKLMISAMPATSQTTTEAPIKPPDHTMSDSDSDSDFESPAHHARSAANHGTKQKIVSITKDVTLSKAPSYSEVKKRKVCSAHESDDNTLSAAVHAIPNTKHPAAGVAQPSDVPDEQLAGHAARVPGAVQATSIKAHPKKICRPRNDFALSVAEALTKEYQTKHTKSPPLQPKLSQLPDTSRDLASQPTRPQAAMLPAHKLGKNASSKLQPKTNSLGPPPQPHPIADHGASLPKFKKANRLNRSRKKPEVHPAKENLDLGPSNSTSKRPTFPLSTADPANTRVPMKESVKLYNRMTNGDDGKNQPDDSSSQGPSTSSGSRHGKRYLKASACKSRAESASKVSENVPAVTHLTHSESVSDECATVPSTPQWARNVSSDEAQMKRLAARVFTPAAGRLQLPEVPKKVGGMPRQAANQQLADHQPAGGEEQLYIVADRYVCESESEEGEQTSEMAKLAMKIKSQLNPPDIIWISIRKLIQDELARLDGLDSQDGAEREVLEGVYVRFKTHMLEYAHELVKHGLMKLRLQKLVAEEKAMSERRGAAGPSVADSTSCAVLDLPSKRAGEPTQPAGGRKRAQKSAGTDEGASKSGPARTTGRPLGLAHSKGILGNSKGKRAKKVK